MGQPGRAPEVVEKLARSRQRVDVAHRYLSENCLEDLIADAMRDLIRSRPTDPHAHLCQYIAQRKPCSPEQRSLLLMYRRLPRVMCSNPLRLRSPYPRPSLKRLNLLLLRNLHLHSRLMSPNPVQPWSPHPKCPNPAQPWSPHLLCPNPVQPWSPHPKCPNPLQLRRPHPRSSPKCSHPLQSLYLHPSPKCKSLLQLWSLQLHLNLMCPNPLQLRSPQLHL